MINELQEGEWQRDPSVLERINNFEYFKEGRPSTRIMPSGTVIRTWKETTEDHAVANFLDTSLLLTESAPLMLFAALAYLDLAKGTEIYDLRAVSEFMIATSFARNIQHRMTNVFARTFFES